jgi:hypothetical protein
MQRTCTAHCMSSVIVFAGPACGRRILVTRSRPNRKEREPGPCLIRSVRKRCCDELLHRRYSALLPALHFDAYACVSTTSRRAAWHRTKARPITRRLRNITSRLLDTIARPRDITRLAITSWQGITPMWRTAITHTRWSTRRKLVSITRTSTARTSRLSSPFPHCAAMAEHLVLASASVPDVRLCSGPTAPVRRKTRQTFDCSPVPPLQVRQERIRTAGFDAGVPATDKIEGDEH